MIDNQKEPTVRLGREETVAHRLRALFESRGFRKVAVNKFEDYALYVENKNFIRAEQIITFMDVDGRLMALKPDVTLSVVKNIPKRTLPCFEKLYYQDEVYRLSRENREYKVLSQIGVELIGPTDSFSGLEIIDLAVESLRAISDRFALDISHLGFVSGLLEQAELSHRVQKRLLGCIHSKSTHEVRRILEQEGTDPAARERIIALSELHGPCKKVLENAQALVCNEQTREAYEELTGVAGILAEAGLADQVNLDFSVVNDVDYYNGLIFLGYIEGVPDVVLTGGRYDNLMSKMGKANGAIGFAVYLSELGKQPEEERTSDFDCLVTYGEDANHAALLREIRRLNAQGLSVRLERDDLYTAHAGFTYDKHYRFTDEKLQEYGL